MPKPKKGKKAIQAKQASNKPPQKKQNNKKEKRKNERIAASNRPTVAAAAGPVFERLYDWEDGATVVIQHGYGKYLQVADNDDTKLDYEGGTGELARWKVHMHEGGTVLQLQSLKTGKMLRMKPDGSDFDVNGTHEGSNTYFLIEKQTAGVAFLKTKKTYHNQHPYIAVENRVHVISKELIFYANDQTMTFVIYDGSNEKGALSPALASVLGQQQVNEIDFHFLSTQDLIRIQSTKNVAVDNNMAVKVKQALTRKQDSFSISLNDIDSIFSNGVAWAEMDEAALEINETDVEVGTVAKVDFKKKMSKQAIEKLKRELKNEKKENKQNLLGKVIRISVALREAIYHESQIDFAMSMAIKLFSSIGCFDQNDFETENQARARNKEGKTANRMLDNKGKKRMESLMKTLKNFNNLGIVYSHLKDENEKDKDGEILLWKMIDCMAKQKSDLLVLSDYNSVVVSRKQNDKFTIAAAKPSWYCLDILFNLSESNVNDEANVLENETALKMENDPKMAKTNKKRVHEYTMKITKEPDYPADSFYSYANFEAGLLFGNMKCNHGCGNVFEKGNKPDRKGQLITECQKLMDIAHKKGFAFEHYLSKNGMIYVEANPSISFADVFGYPVLIMVRCNKEQYDFYLQNYFDLMNKQSTSTVESRSQRNSGRNSQEKETIDKHTSWWNQVIWACLHFLHCRFITIIDDESRMIVLELVKRKNAHLVGCYYTGYCINKIKFLLENVVSSNTCTQQFVTIKEETKRNNNDSNGDDNDNDENDENDENDGNDGNDGSNKKNTRNGNENKNNNSNNNNQTTKYENRYCIMFSKLKEHTNWLFDYTLVLKLKEKESGNIYYAKSYYDLSKKRNENAIELMEKEFECMKIAKKDLNFSQFVPNLFKLTKLGVNTVDLLFLITSDCGVSIDKIGCITDYEKNIIVGYLNNLCKDLKKNGAKYTHGEIDTKHILINESKEIKVIDYDPRKMHIPNNYQWFESIAPNLSDIDAILSRIGPFHGGKLIKLCDCESSSIAYELESSESDDSNLSWQDEKISDRRQHALDVVKCFVNDETLIAFEDINV